MAKIRRGLTEEKIKRLLSEGRGQGYLGEYRPFITVQDVASSGRATRIKGHKTNRIHQFLSDLERNVYLMFEWDDNVIDIQEQYPLLDREDTIKIADELGIKYPRDPKTKEPIIMTTDFYITANINGQIKHFARTCKYAERLNKKRVLEKFQIERIYWRNKGVEWGIITERQINKAMSENLRNLHRYYWIGDDPFLNEKNCGQFLKFIMNEYKESKLSVAEITAAFDYVMQFEVGTGIEIFYYLVANKVLKIDMTKPINLREIKLEDVKY